MAEVSVLIASQDNCDALRLTVESLRRHNTDIRFLVWIWDNGSLDNAQTWARENADRLFIKDGPLGHHHGEALDRMCQEVQTPYLLTLDNDVRTDAPFLRRMVEELREANAFAAAPKAQFSMGTVMHHDRLLHGQPRIDPCCALFDTVQIARMTRHVSFTPYECVNLGKYFDTGGMIRQAAEGAGLRVLDLEWMWESIHHYGALTWGGYAPEGSPIKRQAEARTAILRDDLGGFNESMLAEAEVVVARYKEPLDWLEKCHLGSHVYDKSDEDGPWQKLPNAGREAHTYAEHIFRHYDRLPEVTFFVQGNPFDHVPDFLEQIKTPTSWFRHLGPHRMLTGPSGDECHADLPNARLYKDFTGFPFPETSVPFSPGACFAVHRSVLRRFPRVWWRRLADYLADPDHADWAPWAMERMWKAILTVPNLAHRYHQVMGWFTDHRLYREMVEQSPNEAHFVEVGCWHGRSTLYMATEIVNSRKWIRFDAVDHFRGSEGENEQFMRNEAAASEGGTIRATFDANMGGLLSRINVVQEPSLEAAKLYEDDSLDFVYIDAGHSEEEVCEDIVAWHPKVKPGGVLAGHDFSGAWPGVERAVRRSLGDQFEFVPPMSWKHIKPRT